jgi:sulfite exporter TauE/SafE
MLGFGIGALPSLVFAGLLYKRFKETINRRSIQRLGGVFFMLGGAMIISAPYWINKSFLADYPQLLNLVFCVN